MRACPRGQGLLDACGDQLLQRTLIATLAKISSWFLSAFAGLASFIFTFLGFILLSGLDEQLVASILMGLFAVMLVWIAAEKPNSQHARAVSSLIDRLLAVRSGDLTSPAPALLRREMPALAAAVDGLFEQVRSNLDNVNAMAMYDPVTALPNRIHFRREADRILRARAAGDCTGLLFIDLDGFKEVNDQLGHAQGDQVLVMVANRLRVVVKAETGAGSAPPLLARLAGDEFTILLTGLEGREEAVRIAERSLEALSEPFRSGDTLVEMGASIGVAFCPDHGADLTQLMKAADIAMYHAKASGRSRVCMFNAGLGEASEEKLRTQAALRRALERDELELAFQPQVCTRTGAVVGAEALIRWDRPSGSVRPADGFIGIAEASGLILDIGDWVIDAAALALGRWRVAGQVQRIALNVSAKQLERRDFFPRLRKALASSCSPPWLLELEFTESTATHCDEGIGAELAELRAQGISIAIDDFGSGHSNLARIRQMPVDRVKLDRSLVAEIDSSARARDIVTAVVHLIHGLGCEAVAEGVERQEQVDVLRAIGCDSIQGFSSGEPMTEGAFLRWLRERESAGPAQPSTARRIRA
jgi:diguanylate cyclase (GGDEF)-like protein